MKRLVVLGSILIPIIMLAACSGGKNYHKEQLPDYSGYQAHFPDMDTNGDEMVNYAEFKQYFPDTDAKVFKALDLNQDSAVDHDEWHEFKEAHGLKHDGY